MCVDLYIHNNYTQYTHMYTFSHLADAFIQSFYTKTFILDVINRD